MTSAVKLAALGGQVSTLSRFRGALVGAVLGDCIGGEFEGAEDVPFDRVLQHLSGLEDDTRGDGILQYSDDTAMMRCVSHSLLTRTGFDEQDMARRFAKEYSLAPGRGYGSGVVQVLRKLASPQLSDVFQPAQAQFGGRGSFGNGGAMRAAPFALAFKNAADVRRYSRLGAMLTHSCSLGYNGAVLQALAVHLSLQGTLALPQEFINKLISEMEAVEKDETAQRDSKALFPTADWLWQVVIEESDLSVSQFEQKRLNLAEFPYCARLHKVKELMERNGVSIEEVISELGNGIAALESVPTAIFCVLHCLEAREGLPEHYGGLERTIAYSLALGGDTDTIACMAGAIAGAHYGILAIPQSWQRSCEGAEEADQLAERLYKLYHLDRPEDGMTMSDSNQPHSHGSSQHPPNSD